MQTQVKWIKVVLNNIIKKLKSHSDKQNYVKVIRKGCQLL